MRSFLRLTIAVLFCSVATSWAADYPLPRLQSTTLGESSHPSYYWRTTGVGRTAQLLTLFCHSCQSQMSGQDDQPLVSVLRDTLGDGNPENDRVTDVWLLTYSQLNLTQRLLSAVPFFYWRVGSGPKSVSPRDTAPLFDLTAPQHPVMSEAGRDILQWTMFDPMITPVRATSRAYRTNQIDHERLHLEEAISYLRDAPVSNDDLALTRSQLDLVIARLELRKRLVGGLVTARRAERIGQQSLFEEERIRSRNWELLRQCAERTGLLFEPVDLAGTTGEYAIVWFPLHTSPPAAGNSLAPVWKLLNVRDPWSDPRLKDWKGPVYTRALDENGALSAGNQTGATPMQLIPLGVYSLNYPKVPLLLVDFRDKLHVRWHEMTQRSINEVTAGVIGISHFTNWYYYVAADLYDFVANRHGGAMNQAARLDSYSQFRVALALDHELDPELRREMQRRVDSLAVNPMEASPARELQAARERYAFLVSQATDDGKVEARLEKQRRYELAYFSESNAARVTRDILHDASLGLYTHRAKKDASNLAALDACRRVEYQLHFLDALVQANTPPEVAYDSSHIEASVTELSTLMPEISSPQVRAHVAATIEGLKSLSKDERLQASCTLALDKVRSSGAILRAAQASGVSASPRAAAVDMASPSNLK